MKIGILTWHKALNHGAVLQAYASQKMIERLNEKTFVLDYNRKVCDCRPLKKRLKNKIKKIFNGEILKRNIYKKFDIEKKVLFNRFIDKNLLVGKDFAQELCDAVMVGSDMVFNLLQGYSPYMFGYGIPADYIFSYAASAGGSTYKLAKKMKLENDIRNGLSKFKAVGCRDCETINFVKNVCPSADIYENIDPVLLYGFNEEKKTWDTGKWRNHRPYVLIYSYSGFMNAKRETKEIIRYASDNNLDVVSCGYYHSWCKENINADPKEFLEMFVYADCVVTDTFHGTVFSLINNKNFCSIIRDNGFKLKYLLEQCGLTENIAAKSKDIYNVLNTKTDYSRYDEWIDNQRTLSTDFLKGQIANACALKSTDK